MGIATFCFFLPQLYLWSGAPNLSNESVQIVHFAFLYRSAHLQVRAFVFLPTVKYRGRVSTLVHLLCAWPGFANSVADRARADRARSLALALSPSFLCALIAEQQLARLGSVAKRSLAWWRLRAFGEQGRHA